MPRLPIDFSRTQIYRFVCNDTAIQECYVGSTTNWIHRKATHKFACNNETDKGYNWKIYQTMRENGGWENWSMILIEDYPCKNDLEKRKRERHWQEHYDAKMNMVLAQITVEESKDEQSKYYKEYRETHKEEIAKHQGEKVTCECGCIVSRNCLPRHRKTQKHLELF